MSHPSGANRRYNRHEVNDPNIVIAMTAAYYAKATMVDDNIGRLMERLRAHGLAENTLIVFTADHGNMLGDLNRWFKSAMYEGSTRIPLLLKAPVASPCAAQFKRPNRTGSQDATGSAVHWSHPVNRVIMDLSWV